MVGNAKKILGLDLDGVILDHTQNRILMSQKFGYNLSPADTPSDIITKKLSPEDYQKIHKILYDDPKISLTAALVPGARRGLRYLKQSPDLRYYLISRRNPRDSAMKIIKKYQLWPNYLGPENTFFVKEKKDKDKVAKELGINYFLDDQPSVLSALASVENKFLMDLLGVYNKESQYQGGDYKIVSSWKEFLTHLV